ncbi:MAG: TIGR04282 family arsenosugar biosynthesis glycosyltransferase [Pseudomonadota bacterium]
MTPKMLRRPTLYVMAKVPIAGRAKTRLANDIGPPRAIALNRWMTAKTLKAAVGGPWRTVLAVDPPVALSAKFTCWSRAEYRCPQVGGDLGARLNAIVASAPVGPVGIIGVDAPLISRNALQRAFAHLTSCDAVFGPADDGGFWFVGLRRLKPPPRYLFKNVRWSTEYSLQDAAASLPTQYAVKYASQLSDLDDGSSLKAFNASDLCMSCLS